ncbi:ABC transporter permease [Clostridium algidicarnis]|uniref:ABC transporter permease n=1 Tax=Clostridium algidicarnis TaxID=37659 RepID=UPI00162545EE|nr:ABC transporter permease [Clostridium algidicarnis]MBB6698277.1 ABC transporter permease [Clostridium algidicarnis]MBU3197404.1 ABC transporter permease [Clostridium algidicarnis]
MINRIKEIMKYKELLFNLTRKELKLKYKNSVLGFFWSFLNPVVMLLVYTFAFKYVLRIQTENFAVFLLAGLLPWTFFQMSVQGSTFSLISNSALIKKVYFPREIIPLSLVFSNFVNFLMTFVVLFISMFIFKVKISIALITLPLVLLIFLMITIGLCLLLSSINVVYRDVSHFVEVLFMAWFYLTPIVYSFDLVPDKLKIITMLNPMTLVVETLRDCMIRGEMPRISYLLGMTAFAIIFMLVGHKVFSNIEKIFAEII